MRHPVAMYQFAQKYGQISRGYVGNSASILSHAKSKWCVLRQVAQKNGQIPTGIRELPLTTLSFSGETGSGCPLSKALIEFLAGRFFSVTRGHARFARSPLVIRLGDSGYREVLNLEWHYDYKIGTVTLTEH